MEKKETFAADTSQRTASDWVRALLLLFLGLAIAHLGVTLFLLSELGTDTFTVFIQGLSRVFGLSCSLQSTETQSWEFGFAVWWQAV